MEFIPEFGFRDLRELGPWESTVVDSITITAVPVQHFSGRYGIDRAWTDGIGYTGYVLEYAGITVYFAGDTGWHDRSFKEVGERFRIDLAIIPIGPGDSPRVGGRIHVEPGGALQIFEEVRARFLLPMHHGTVPYTSDGPPNASITTLRDLVRQRGLGDRLIDLEIGEQRVLYPTGAQRVSESNDTRPAE